MQDFVAMGKLNKCAKFHIVQAVKKLNSISRERLNFRRWPFLCTTLYKNPLQASSFGGTFDQLFFRIFMQFSHKLPLYFFYTIVQKSQNDQNSKQGAPASRQDAPPPPQIDPLPPPPILEAILVIFGRNFLNFCLKALGKIEKDTTFVRMHSGDHLGDTKMSEKGTSLRRI